jgi:hypothetical protein
MAWRALLLDGTLLFAPVCYWKLGVESGDGQRLSSPCGRVGQLPPPTAGRDSLLPLCSSFLPAWCHGSISNFMSRAAPIRRAYNGEGQGALRENKRRSAQ